MIFMDIKKIIIGTGSYDTVKSGNCVSVTGDGGNAWGFYGQAYKKLAPRLKTYLPYAEEYEELKKIKDNSSYIELKKEIEFSISDKSTLSESLSLPKTASYITPMVKYCIYSYTHCVCLERTQML